MVKSPRIKASPFGAMLGGVAAPSERFNYTAAVGCRPSAVVLFSAENSSSVIGNTYTPRRGFIAVKRRSHEVLRLVFNYWSGLCRSCQGYEKFFATGSHPPAWHRRKNFFSALRATLTRLAPLTWSCILAVAFLYARGASTPRAPRLCLLATLTATTVAPPRSWHERYPACNVLEATPPTVGKRIGGAN